MSDLLNIIPDLFLSSGIHYFGYLWFFALSITGLVASALFGPRRTNPAVYYGGVALFAGCLLVTVQLRVQAVPAETLMAELNKSCSRGEVTKVGEQFGVGHIITYSDLFAIRTYCSYADASATEGSTAGI